MAAMSTCGTSISHPVCVSAQDRSAAHRSILFMYFRQSACAKRKITMHAMQMATHIHSPFDTFSKPKSSCKEPQASALSPYRATAIISVTQLTGETYRSHFRKSGAEL